MAELVKSYGLADFKPHANYYQALVKSIIGQQLSVKAAAKIRERFIDLFGGKFPTPEIIVTKNVDELRSVGLSRAKAAYVQDLAEHIIDGRLEINRLPELSDEELIAELIDIKGIGEWTAHMFMMFSLGRLNILPVGDLGIRNGIKKLYRLKILPDGNAVQKVATTNKWAPYQSVASWYVWESLDNVPESIMKK